LDKYTKTEVCGLPTVEELRASLLSGENSDARTQIAMLFDESTFVETNAYAKRAFSDFLATEKANELESVITGYGAIDGKLVFAFAEDASRMDGVIDERHAKKIVDLYSLAIKSGAPVIGIFNSNGTDVFGGAAGLAAYGKIMNAVATASGTIPQIAFVSGKCIGTAAAIAAMFDFVVKASDASLYVTSPTLTGNEGAQDALITYQDTTNACAEYLKRLISFLPDNSSTGIECADTSDTLNRLLGDVDFGGEALSAIATIADNAVFYEVGGDYATVTSTAFASIGGVKCGIVANSFAKNEGKLCSLCARKIARFVNFCDSFSIPVVTLVDSNGLAIDKNNESCFAPELAKLAFAYAQSGSPKVTVIMGHAIGASFVLLGSKSLGADIVYAVDNSEIAALNADSGVAFAWDRYITEEKSRTDLINEWKQNVSSPANAAASGEIDDIISVNELRARICSALQMLCGKVVLPVASRKVQPL